MKILRKVIREIVDHAKQEAPLEACGYLGSKDGIIKKIYALTNIDKSNEHFSFEPKEQFLAVKDARAQGLEICAVYHSHPASPARPSQEDIKLAYDPNMSYFIISLADGNKELRAFSIKSGVIVEIILEVIDDKGV
ncbi:MAG: M67 family metallopeptidase [Candidatus Omnitrophica bacterium]|nr:M67 family metallopeptidase [Candidatus Omnitrophota bacterium]MBU4303703.1 M67 family metallopeptidase [Candidatus Omnitrophota bacterium]MBU4419360.1 M67 family metallopeptidase [Candidatus Omnitrophota bacterium]